MTEVEAYGVQRSIEAVVLVWATVCFLNGVGMFGDVVPLGYALTLPTWPLSSLLALWWLRTPQLARQARITLVAVILIVSSQLLPWAWDVWWWASASREPLAGSAVCSG